MDNRILKENVQEIVKELREIAELFYQQNDSEAFEKFDLTIDKIENLIDNLNKYYEENREIEFNKEKICSILSEAMEALESEDKILMADILQYDFVEYIEEIFNKIS